MEVLMKNLPVRILITVITSAVIGGLVFGFFALLVSGPDGVINGILLGLVFAFVYRIGRWWQVRQSGEENEHGV
jgi:hypothetical protein